MTQTSGGGLKAVWLAMTVIAMSLALSSPSAQAKQLKGVALIIGQSDYEHLPKLANPTRDARDVEELLDSLGFETSVGSDRDARRLSRDLDGFVDDAEGADVAILYYAGHGIEAGGENFLVPVDADLSAIEAAGERLVPLSGILERLKATVPVVIVMLDACRDNPFPPGSMLRMDGGATTLAVSASGLGETRGAKSLNTSASAPDDNLGTVIAFAAEPGRVALDGPAGSNSPYASAILRHFAVMQGEEFSTVMRMVTEEVYLKTSGKQRPWVSESMRRMLTFGDAPPEIQGPEGAILRERRQLLVTISDLPVLERRRIEKVASEGGVPMDAVFAILKAMGTDAPSDPAALEATLRSKADLLREMMAERQVLTSSDPEVARLMALADKAISEGALETALELQFEASERIEQIQSDLGDVQKNLDARRLEFADVSERKAETYLLAFKHRFAAEELEYTAGEIAHIDPDRAYRMNRAAIDAYIEAGRYGRGLLELASGARLAEETLPYASNFGAVVAAEHKSDLALLEYLVAEWRRDLGDLATAHRWFEEALPVLEEQGTAAQKAEIKTRYGTALATIGDISGDSTLMTQAVSILEQAVAVLPADADLASRSNAERSLSAALVRLGKHDKDAKPVERAVALIEAQAAQVSTDTASLEWASTQEALGAAKAELGILNNDATILREAVAHYRGALQQRQQDRMPRQRNLTQFAFGEALRELGLRESGDDALVESVAVQTEMFANRESDYQSLEWADGALALGASYQALAERRNDATLAANAASAFNEAFFIYRRTDRARMFVTVAEKMAQALTLLGRIDGRKSRLAFAAEAVESALEIARTLPEAADDVPRLAAALEAARASLDATGNATFTSEDQINPTFEAQTPEWAINKIRNGRDDLQEAFDTQSAEKYMEAKTAFREGLDASLVSVSPADRSRLYHGLARSIAGATMINPTVENVTAAVAAVEKALTQSNLLDPADRAALHADLGWLLAFQFDQRPRTDKSGAAVTPQRGDVERLVRASRAIREALTASPDDPYAATWPQTADFIARQLLYTVGSADHAEETILIAKAALEAAQAQPDEAIKAGSMYLVADAYLSASELGVQDGLAEAMDYARRAIDIYGALGAPQGALYPQDTLCAAGRQQAQKLRDKGIAQQALAACDAALATIAGMDNRAHLEPLVSANRAKAAQVVESLR